MTTTTGSEYILEVGLAPSTDGGGVSSWLLAAGLCCIPAAGGVRALAASL